jgi:FHA domain-containing protein
MTDPIEVLLKFAFIAVLYLFLLWVARSALKDLGRPAGRAESPPEHAEILDAGFRDGGIASPARLVAEQGGGLEPGASFVVGSGITIGRAQGSEVRIDDTYASGRHARIYGREGRVYVEDMNSTNGTYVNGRRVSTQELLRPDDRIRIGDTEFRYEP